jgi:hypothetical protein
MNNIDQSSLIGSIAPTVLIKKITLSSGAQINDNIGMGKNPHVNIPSLPPRGSIKDQISGLYEELEISPLELAGDPAKLNKVKNASALSEAQGSTKVSLTLVVKDKVKENDVASFFNNEEFTNFIKIRVIQSTNPSLTTRFADGTKDILDNNLSIIPTAGVSAIDTMLEAKQENIKDYFIGVDDEGNKQYELTFDATFEIVDTDPAHAVYFAVAYIDKVKLAEYFGLATSDLESMSDELRGQVAIEPVILNGSVINTSTVYQDSFEKVWLGPTTKNTAGNVLKGVLSDPDSYEGEELLNLLLIPRTVPNIKIHDLRLVSKVDSFDIDFGDIERTLLEENLDVINFLSSKSQVPELKDAFTVAMHSRDQVSKNRFIFGVNVERLLKEFSNYSKFYEIAPNTTKKQLLNTVGLRNIVIKRRRITETGEDFDDTEFNTVIASGLDNLGENGRVRNARIKVGGFRYFQVIDNDVASKEDSIFKYIVEMDFQDDIEEFLRRNYLDLINAKEAVEAFYNTATTPKNYFPSTNTYTPNFIKEYTPVYESEVVPSISTYFDVLQLLGGRLDNFEGIAITFNVLLNPRTGTPSGLSAIMKLMDDLANKLYRLIDGRVVNEKVAYPQSGTVTEGGVLAGGKARRIVKITKELDGEFRSTKGGVVGYDFLYDIVDMAKNEIGLPYLSHEQYRERVEKETLKYFKGLRSKIDIATDKVTFTKDDTVESTICGFLSPTRILMPGETGLRLMQSGIGDYKKYSHYMARVLDFNDPGVNSVTDPVRSSNITTENQLKSERLRAQVEMLLGGSGVTIGKRNAPITKTSPTSDINVDEGEPVSKTSLIKQDSKQANVNNALLAVLGLQRLDLEGQSVEEFNLNNEETVTKLAEGAAGLLLASVLFGIDANPFKELPNQIKALVLSFIKQDLVNNIFNKDVIRLGDSFFSIYSNYFNLMRVEYLADYERVGLQPSIKAPVWKTLDTKTLGLAKTQRKELLCRLVRYEGGVFKIKDKPELSLPVFNEHFLIRSEPNNSALIEFISSTSGQELAETEQIDPEEAVVEEISSTTEDIEKEKTFEDLAQPVNSTIETYSPIGLVNVEPVIAETDFETTDTLQSAEEQVTQEDSGLITDEQNDSATTISQPLNIGALF